MPDILANPNALPARADMQVRSDGILDLANFVAEVVPAPDSVLASLGGDLREYGMLRRDDQVAALMQQRQDKLVEAEWEVIPGGDAPADVAAADFLREQLAASTLTRPAAKCTVPCCTATVWPNACGDGTAAASPYRTSACARPGVSASPRTGS